MATGSAYVPHDIDAPIRGAARGPLAGLTLAVKDMYDIAGQRTGGGNPAWLADHAPADRHAEAIACLLQAGASIVGRTICDEFLYSITGVNCHYGTPVNARAPARIPGGSSSGSAVTVAAGAADIGLGSDTGGSIRVPASFNGIYGMRPTTGRVSLAGAMPMSASFDTPGWFAASAGVLRSVGPVLLRGAASATPASRLLIARDLLDLCDAPVAEAFQRFSDRASAALPPSGEVTISPGGFHAWQEAFRSIQAHEVWAYYGRWLESHEVRMGMDIAERFAYARTVTSDAATQARSLMASARGHIRSLLDHGTVVLLPTVPVTAPLTTATSEVLNAFRTRTMAFTCIAGLGGVPQVTLPAGNSDGCPVGVSILGGADSDEVLLDLAVRLSRYCGE